MIIIIGVVLKSQNNRMLEIIDIQKESYDKQKAAINAAEIEKELQKQKIEKEYTDAITTIEAVYKIHNKKLEERKKKEIKNIVKKYYNEPEEISSRIFKSFGLIYVPTKNNNNPD